MVTIKYKFITFVPELTAKGGLLVTHVTDTWKNIS